MCGIVGIAGTNTKVVDDSFENMLIMDAVRGPHSVGVAALHTASNMPTVLKKATDPLTFLDLKTWGSIKGKANSLYIGHNRWATKGAINNESAHPFQHEHITGVHNGTLIQQSLLPDHEKFEVDSENIIHSIAKIGIEETWKKVNGVAALVWWDAEQKTLNMCRNKERPLSFTFSEDNKHLIFSSEPIIAMAACMRNGMKLHKFDDVEVNTLYSFTIPAIGKKFDDFEVKPLDPFVQPPTKGVIVGGQGASTGTFNSISIKLDDRIYFNMRSLYRTQHNMWCIECDMAYSDIDVVVRILFFSEDLAKAKFKAGKLSSGKVKMMHKQANYGWVITIDIVTIDDPISFEKLEEWQVDMSNKTTSPFVQCANCGETLTKTTGSLPIGENLALCDLCVKMQEPYTKHLMEKHNAN